MVTVLKTYKYKDINKTPKRENIFYVFQNFETKMYYSTKYGAVENICNASRYKTVGMLKSVINQIYFPKKSIVLQLLEETGTWTEKKLPKDTFDEFLVHEVMVTE